MDAHDPEPDIARIDDTTWCRLLARDPAAARPAPYAELLAPPRLALGRLAQSLDGRIATASGHAFWISGPSDILHTHRLRALFDAIIVGAGTVRADDPLLTTRLCPGASPVRVILDPQRRLHAGHRVFAAPPRTLLVCADDQPGPQHLGAAEVLTVPRDAAGLLDLAVLLDRLAAIGLPRVFVEGGGLTVSRFLAADLLDRLHVTIAPMLLGAGVPAFTLPGVSRADQARRLDWRVHRLGADLLLDIPLRPA